VEFGFGETYCLYLQCRTVSHATEQQADISEERTASVFRIGCLSLTLLFNDEVEAVCSSETSVNLTTQRYMLEDSNIQ
jgi:hypothetical protein